MRHEQAVNTAAIARYLLGRMTNEERDACEEHFFSCPECAEEICLLSALQEHLCATRITCAGKRFGCSFQPAARSHSGSATRFKKGRSLAS